MKKFVTIFPSYRNFHFYKDPGQIPYRFKNKGWEAELVCFKNEESYLPTSNYLPVKTVPAIRFNIDLIWYLVKTAHKIDVLNVYHFQWGSLWLGFIYKLLNTKGIAYLKMDNCNNCGPYPWEHLYDKHIEIKHDFLQQSNTIKHRLKNKPIPFLARYIDIYSIEDKESCNYYENKYPVFRNKIITVLNGHTIDLLSNSLKIKEFTDKRNIILSVGRFGTFQKDTELLLDAFIAVAKQSSWELHLAGHLTKEFELFKEKYFKENPELISKVIFLGSLAKKELFELYNQSKIFCLPSRFEGFANVYSEAMYFGNAIITTPKTSVKDILIENEFGALVEVGNVSQLSTTLLKIINNPALNERYANNAKAFCENNLSWDTITDKLQKEIKRRLAMENSKK